MMGSHLAILRMLQKLLHPENYRDSFSSSKHGTRCYTVEDSFRKLQLQSNLQALQFVLKADWSWNSPYPGEKKAAGAEES